MGLLYNNAIRPGGSLRRRHRDVTIASRLLGMECLEPRLLLSATVDLDWPKETLDIEMAAAPEFASVDGSMAAALSSAWDIPADATADSWVIVLDSDDTSTLSGLGATDHTPAGHLEHAFVIGLAEPIDVGAFTESVQALPDVEFFFPLIARARSSRFVPNDPLYGDQWHLNNTGQSGGTVGVDANVEPAWDTVTGAGVVIGIVDDGLERTHPDLSGNYLASASYDYYSGDSNPTPSVGSNHGTAVAGVAAADGNNGVGVAGVAFDAQLAGIRAIVSATTDSLEANALGHQPQTIDIYNNSWGPVDGTDWLDAPGPLTLAAIENGVTSGRGGLGNIYVWAGGNGLQLLDNVNFDGYANSRYTIAVAAIDHNGNQSWYSEPGAPLIVSAYSDGYTSHITTTDRLGDLGYNEEGAFESPFPDSLEDTDYTSTFGGTSSATPVVSGVVALMLETNPNLTWRDVQHILVETAAKNDPFDSDWTVNAAGHDINHKYGFGAVDADAAVTAATGWTNVAPQVSTTPGRKVVNRSIADGSGSTADAPRYAAATVSSTSVSENINIEWVEVKFNATHTYRGDLEVVLTSPSGTQSVLAQPNEDGANNYTNWVFTSVRHWGETSAGQWTLSVRDGVADDVGIFADWTITLYGTELPEPLLVTDFSPTASGFVAQFDRPLDPAVLNLYDVEAGTWGAADVSVTGRTTGPVSGSLVVGDDKVTFVAEGGPLPADIYDVVLRSGADAFKGQAIGALLDGDGNGVAGDSFTASFAAAPELVVVRLPDFARGPGQSVDVPATKSNLPLTLIDQRTPRGGIESIDLTITYDPALLNITGAVLGSDAPAGATLEYNAETPGQITIAFETLATPLDGGESVFVALTANVPDPAPFNRLNLLDVTDLVVTDPNESVIAATADDAIHHAAYLGDTTGSSNYSGLDAQRVARVVVGLDTGFSVFPLVSPRIIADVTGDGMLSGLDAQRIARKVVGLAAPEIPDLPDAAATALKSPAIGQATSLVGLSESSPHDEPLTDAQFSPVVEAAAARIAAVEGPDTAALRRVWDDGNLYLDDDSDLDTLDADPILEAFDAAFAAN